VTTTAILPVKRFERAKQRLGDTIDAASRAALAAAMLADVMTALGSARVIDRVIVVSSEPEAERLASAADALLVADPQEVGQPLAARAGLERAAALGFEHAVLVPGDCPLLDPEQIDGLLATAQRDELDLVIVPDRHGEGTNALLLGPSGPYEPAFGPGSLQRHLDQARRLGLQHSVERVPSLALDVDTAGDLSALEAALTRAPDRARATRVALAQLGRTGQSTLPA
jgi:2-phospho-L-lactate guanylyltransferase